MELACRNVTGLLLLFAHSSEADIQLVSKKARDLRLTEKEREEEKEKGVRNEKRRDRVEGRRRGRDRHRLTGGNGQRHFSKNLTGSSWRSSPCRPEGHGS